MSMQETLERLTRVTGVTAAVITDYEGIPIEAQTAVGFVSVDDLSARAAEIGRLARQTAEVWGGGRMEIAFFESSMGGLTLADLGRGYLLVVNDPTVNTGMLRLGVEQAVQELQRLLSRSFMSAGGPGRMASA